MKIWQRILWTTLALLWIQAIAALTHPIARVPADMWAAFSVDAVLLLALAAIGSVAGWPRVAAHVAAWLLVLSSIFRAASEVVMELQGRMFELADCELFYALFFVWLKDEVDAVRWTWAAVIIAAPLAVIWITSRAFRRIAFESQRSRFAWSALAICQLLVIGGWVAAARGPNGATWWRPSSLLQVSDEVIRSIRVWLDPEIVRQPIREQIADGTRRMNEVPHGMEHLAGIDVHFVVVESYGRFAWRHPDVRPELLANVDRWEAALEASGLDARTGAVAPAVIGGASERAHAELLGGLPVRDRLTWEMLIASELIPLSKHMRNAGWHTVEMMPQMPFHWQAGYDFYGVEQGFAQPELPYEGFVYHFGRIPDQYGLHRLLTRAIAPATKPVFSMFVSVSSHAPWSAIPRYVEDWQINEQTFAEDPAQQYTFTYTDVPHADGLTVAYGDSVNYALQCAFGFAQQLRRPSLVVIVGDHQPPISRSARPADTSADVPIHVLSNRPGLLARIDELGFAAGLRLPDEWVSFPMADLAPALLRLYSE